MILEYSYQRRHVILEGSDRLISHRGESLIVRHEKGDTIGFLEELGGSYVCTIRRWDLDRSQ